MRLKFYTIPLVTLLAAHCAGNNQEKSDSKTNSFSNHINKSLFCAIELEELQSDGTHKLVHNLETNTDISAPTRQTPLQIRNKNGGIVGITFASAKDMFSFENTNGGRHIREDGLGIAIQTLSSAASLPKKYLTFVDLRAGTIYFYQSFDLDQTIEGLELADNKTVNIDRISLMCNSTETPAVTPKAVPVATEQSEIIPAKAEQEKDSTRPSQSK